VKSFMTIPALALLGVLAACSGMSNSGASGAAGRSDVGISNASNGGGFWNNLGGGPDARAASSYRNELRSEQSN
jgi:ABC-type sugar transport system substrate-binding protein